MLCGGDGGGTGVFYGGLRRKVGFCGAVIDPGQALANNFGIYHRYCRWLDGDANESIGRSVNQLLEN